MPTRVHLVVAAVHLVVAVAVRLPLVLMVPHSSDQTIARDCSDDGSPSSLRPATNEVERLPVAAEFVLGSSNDTDTPRRPAPVRDLATRAVAD